MKALLSVSDRAGLADLGKSLVEAGFELVSTGGTGQHLADAGLPVTQVSDLTGSPEILDGRVKTLHPKIHGAILARRDLESHLAELAEHGIGPIDLVAVNLYPFVETVTGADATLEEALENIDIGGPTLLRAAAKNFPDVLVVVDPDDYGWLGQRLGAREPVTLEERRGLARKAFQHVALYDSAVSRYLGGDDGGMPEETAFGFTKLYNLRYGENPHQRASLYADPLSKGGVARARLLHGSPLSYNNLLDADAAWRVVSDFDQPAAAVIKHTNPCGLALHADQAEAYRRAFEGDSTSAYGGIVAFNTTLTAAAARAMRGVFYEIVLAPGYEQEALDRLRRRRTLRILEVAASAGAARADDLRLVTGGALVQTPDESEDDPASWRIATKRRPTEAELADLAFAWKAAKHVKSNAIVLANDGSIVGIGAGQPNRINSVHLALRTAGERAQGSVLASDAFFPFADNVETAAAGGIAAIVQPGGSIRDEEVVAAADAAGVSMLFTGVRHFRH